MTYSKLSGALAALAIIASPAIAQDLQDAPKMDHSGMDGEAMDHSKMDHSKHDMAPAETDTGDAVVPVSADAEIVTAKVNGLVCDFCAQSLRKVFKKQDAVEKINVDLDNGEVKVTLKSGAEMDDETVGKLIRKSGYSLVDIQRSGGA